MSTTTDTPARLRTTERTLPVKLTTSEILQHGRDMAKGRRDYAALDEQRKSVADDFKSRLAAADMTTERHARAVETGEEPRQVECADELIGNVVRAIRLDTGEILSSRPATAADKQVDLLGDPDGDDGSDDPPAPSKRSRKGR